MKKLLFSFSLLLSSSLASAQWIQVNNTPFRDNHSNGFGFKGKGYLIQGSPSHTGSDGQTKNVLWEYDPLTDNWTSLGPVPGPGRSVSIGDDMDGKYYFGFGSGRNDLWEYDPATNTFTELPECPCLPRSHPAFVAYNGKIFMGSGSSSEGDLHDWWVYDFATEQWSQKTDIPGGRRHHPFQFGIDDVIYVGGGHRNNWSKYDITTEEWSSINSFPSGRVAGTQFSFENMGFILSGDTREHDPLPDNEFLMYEPDLDEWYQLPFEKDMHRWAPSSMIIDNFVYFLGGYGGLGGSSLRMWKFDLSSVHCLAPLNIYAPSTTENSAELLWGDIPNGVIDTLQWREKGSSFWNIESGLRTGFILEGLEACTDYEFRVHVSCDTKSIYSEITSFRTKGCGSCTDLEYCNVNNDFNPDYVFIERVRIQNFENRSGNTRFEGYHSYTEFDQVQVYPQESFEIEIEPGFGFFVFDRAYCKVWIDFDGDADFKNDELVIDERDFENTFVRNIKVPTNTKAGVVRMRIMIGSEALSGACEGTLSLEGEVEDYCITILENTSGANDYSNKNPEDIHISPNPNTGIFNLEYSKGEHYQIHDNSGRLISEGPLTPAFGKKTIQNFQLEGLNPGVYLIKVIDGKEISILMFVKN